MNDFDERWQELARRAARHPAPGIPASPRHLAARVGEVRMRAIIPRPVALAAAALIYLAVLPALPGALAAMDGDPSKALTWLPAAPHLPTAPSLPLEPR